MTVVPMIIEAGESQTVLTEHEAEEFRRDGDKILIVGIDGEQFDADKRDCNTSYDLRVGKLYRDHRKRDPQTLADDGTITLHPGMAVIIETEEEVSFSMGTFGIILPRVSLLQKGIANVPTKVDPGYPGRLLITTFNLGQRKVTLKRRQPFCALTVIRVAKGVRPYRKGGQRIIGVEGGSAWERTRDWFQSNSVIFGVAAAIATVTSGVVTIVINLL